MRDRICHQNEFRVNPLEANWVKVVQIIDLVGQCKAIDLNEVWVDARVLYQQGKAGLHLFCLRGIGSGFTNYLNCISLAGWA